jgi:hypothetical protein
MHAGVARPTVYAAFSGKPALLKHAIDLHLADDVPVPVRERPWFQEFLQQRDHTACSSCTHATAAT